MCVFCPKTRFCDRRNLTRLLAVQYNCGMDLKFKKAASPQDFDAVAALADEIWHQHYGRFLTKDHIDYMVSSFQSADAVAEQCANGAEYYIALADGKPIGYIGLEFPPDECFLSKLYLRKSMRGLGIGSKMFDLAEKLAKDHGETSIMLHVNKYNDSSIAVYERRGFVKKRDLVTDIGHGFVMDDYVYVKKL